MVKRTGLCRAVPVDPSQSLAAGGVELLASVCSQGGLQRKRKVVKEVGASQEQR